MTLAIQHSHFLRIFIDDLVTLQASVNRNIPRNPSQNLMNFPSDVAVFSLNKNNNSLFITSLLQYFCKGHAKQGYLQAPN